MRQDTQEKKQSRSSWLLFSFKGRVSRKVYWVFNLAIIFAGVMFGLLTEPADHITKYQLMFMLWILWPSLAIQAKRWHDIDKSALWLLINLIPIAGPIWSLIQNGFVPGTCGPNQFGPDDSCSKDQGG